ncbi:uncharacterized protein LOC122503927 [Leptopilina heterotoma]|uniref:uncharacterized protein LOC122503927 n=1 Tax=Leptopilina heterotoma TaxID=63436 RepID=UPI001CA8FEF3|nr:uncharacterized protein LOC122503927 [Leptopilina heterotoma]
MSKFLFVFCAILFVGTSVYGAEDAGTIMKMKNEVVEAAEKAHSILKQNLNEYSGKIKKLISKLQEEAIDLRSVAYKNVASTENQVMARIDKAIQDATGTDVEECRNMAKSLKPIVSETLVDANNCVESRIKKAIDTWKDLYHQAEKSLKTLIDVKSDVEVCVKDINNWRSIPYASYCVTKVAAVGTFETATNVPGIVLNITDLYFQVQSFLPELQACVSSKTIENMKGTSEQVVTNVISCVKAEVKSQHSKAPQKSWMKKFIPW